MSDVVLSILVSGVVLGSLYVMMAVGLSLVWSTLGIFNFAHGALIMIGAYVAWTVGTAEGLGGGPLVGVVAALAAAGLIGLLIERVLVRPFQGGRSVVLLAVITTLAAAVMLENLALIGWGGRMKRMPPLAEGSVGILGVTVSAHEALIIVVAPAVLVALALFLKFSRTGSAIRAVGQNSEAATLIGIEVNVLYAAAFAISAMLAALAGILLGSIRFITPVMGNEPLLKAMIVAIFGGLGSLTGTIAAAYLIGFIEALLIFHVGLYWTPALLFALMIAVLLARPTGLFGER